MFVSIGKAAQLLGVSASTLRRWDNSQRLSAQFKTFGGHRRYQVTKLLETTQQITPIPRPPETIGQTRPRAVLYSRVSATKQRDDLKRQQDQLRDYTESQNWDLVKSYQDIGSGLNDRRPGILRLIKELPTLQPDFVVCSYPDRLSRFGLQFLVTICQLFSVKIIIAGQGQTNLPLDQQLTQDVLAVLTSFAGKLYRSRRGRPLKKSSLSSVSATC